MEDVRGLFSDVLLKNRKGSLIKINLCDNIYRLVREIFLHANMKALKRKYKGREIYLIIIHCFHNKQ